MSAKAAVIKPIFLAICSRNDDMADWIIDKFLVKNARAEEIDLIGSIIAVNKGLSIPRIRKLCAFVLQAIENPENSSCDNILHFIDILLE
jgi:hypothetical protein